MNQLDQVKIATGIIEASARDAIMRAETLDDKFRVAFKEANNYWLSTDEDIRFKGGIGAVMLSVGIDSPEYERIATELKSLSHLAALMSGIPLDLSAISPLPDGFEPIGLTKLWPDGFEPIGITQLWKEIKQ